MTKLADSKRVEAFRMCARGIKKVSIARQLGISRVHVYNILRTGGMRHPRQRFTRLTAKQRSDLASLTQPGATGTLVDIVKEVDVPYATAWRFVHRYLGRVRKVGDTRFINADPEAQRIFIYNANILGRHPSYFVWGDEVTVDHRCATDGVVWAQRGKPIHHVTASGRGQVARLICFSSLDGHVYLQAQPNTYDKPHIIDIIKKVVSRMNSYPNSRSILVLDNAPIHDAQEICQICAAKGVIYLPLPTLGNPIFGAGAGAGAENL